MRIFGIFKRWRRRREIIRRLVAYAKTKDGRKFIEEMNEGNLILADYEAEILGAENPLVGKTLRIRLPNDYIGDRGLLPAEWTVPRFANRGTLPKDHFVHIGSGWMDK